jgi:hypothetical protein
MTSDDAKRIAIEYLRSHPDLSDSCELEPSDVFLVSAKYRPERNATADAWIVHFPLILPAGICQEPSTRGILVDTVTGEASVPVLL